MKEKIVLQVLKTAINVKNTTNKIEIKFIYFLMKSFTLFMVILSRITGFHSH